MPGVQDQNLSLDSDNFAQHGKHVGRVGGVLSRDIEGPRAGVPGVTVGGSLFGRGTGATDAESKNADSAATLHRLLVVLVKGRFGAAAEAHIHADALSDQDLRGAHFLLHGRSLGFHLGDEVVDIDIPAHHFLSEGL